MPSNWQTDEVVRWLTTDADLDEIRDVIHEAGDEAPEALQEWIRKGNAPKGLYDAMLRFATIPDQAFTPVDWEAVVEQVMSDE
jgi:hypothetical protein